MDFIKFYCVYFYHFSYVSISIAFPAFLLWFPIFRPYTPYSYGSFPQSPHSPYFHPNSLDSHPIPRILTQIFHTPIPIPCITTPILCINPILCILCIVIINLYKWTWTFLYTAVSIGP